MWELPGCYRSREAPVTPCSGFIDITASGLLIARIPVAIAIDARPTELQLNHSTSEMVRRVFASYCRKDEAVVRACKAAYRLLATNLLLIKTISSPDTVAISNSSENTRAASS